MKELKKNERLVYAGEAALRAPGGTPLPSVPCFIKVSLDETTPATVAVIGNKERVVYAGFVTHDKRRAEERFAAMKAGKPAPPKEEITPLYIVTDEENVNKKTGLPHDTAKDLFTLGKELAELISIQERKERALEKQGITSNEQ